MRKLRAWLLRLWGLPNQKLQDQQFAEEIESHLQMHIADNLRAGMDPERARRDALLKLGGIETTTQGYREGHTSLSSKRCGKISATHFASSARIPPSPSLRSLCSRSESAPPLESSSSPTLR